MEMIMPGDNVTITVKLIQANATGTVIVWAWHIIDEVTEQLEGLGFKGEVWTPLPKFELFKILE